MRLDLSYVFTVRVKYKEHNLIYSGWLLLGHGGLTLHKMFSQHKSKSSSGLSNIPAQYPSFFAFSTSWRKASFWKYLYTLFLVVFAYFRSYLEDFANTNYYWRGDLCMDILTFIPTGCPLTIEKVAHVGFGSSKTSLQGNILNMVITFLGVKMFNFDVIPWHKQLS